MAELGGEVVVTPDRRILSGQGNFDFVIHKDSHGNWRCLNDKFVTVGTPAKQAYRTGVRFASQGRNAEALTFFDKSIKLDSSYAQSFADRGRVHLVLDHPAKALRDLNKAVILNPENTDGYVNRSIAFTQLNQYQKGIDYCHKAIALGDPALAHATLGELYVKNGQFGEAIKELTVAISLNPKLAQLYFFRSVAYMPGLVKSNLLQKINVKQAILAIKQGNHI